MGEFTNELVNSANSPKVFSVFAIIQTFLQAHQLLTAFGKSSGRIKSGSFEAPDFVGRVF